jgi:hypothetical protein
MEKTTEAAEEARLRSGVFQPGRAEIAREMRCRLNPCHPSGEALAKDADQPVAGSD